MTLQPALYVGTIRHRRFRPARHEFTYPLFMVCLNVDRIDEMMSVSPFASVNRWNWASFYHEDHFGNAAVSLRKRLAHDAEAHGTALPNGKILLLTHLRYLGYNFNPVSFFFCHDASGEVQAIVAEVNNTFGETHNYWLRVDHRASQSRSTRHEFDKEFHVSPFMSLDQRYQWIFSQREDSLLIQTNSFEDDQHIFDATLKLEAREWNRTNLHRALRSFPWMTAKVIAAIHWEAVRLWWKKVPIVHHPGSGRWTKANVQHFAASWDPGTKAATNPVEQLSENQQSDEVLTAQAPRH